MSGMDNSEEEGFEREIRTKNDNERPRRRRRRVGEGSGPPQNPIFVNKAAEDWYTQYRSRKSLTKERALSLPEEFSPFVRETLVFYEWASPLDGDRSRVWFTSDPGLVMVNLVYEFYANLRHGGHLLGTEVMVRGLAVDWSAEAIHDIYQIPPTPDCWYSDMIRQTIDWDELLGELVGPEAVWTYGRTNEREHFPASWLTRDQHILFLWIAACLLPSSHTSEVTKERALLLYAMIKRRPLSAGQIIRSSIMTAAQGVGNRGLVMPSLISTLCLRRDVPLLEGEPTEKPRGAINVLSFRSVADVAPAPPHQRAPPPPRPQPAPPAPPAPPVPEHWPQFERRMDQVEEQMRGFGLRITHMQAAQQARHRYEDSRDDYSFTCWEQMHEMMRQQLPESQRASFVLPPRPLSQQRARRGRLPSDSEEDD